MLVVNHCGVTNAVFHTSRFPRPYSSLVEAEGRVTVDYSPAGVDLARLKEAIQYQLDIKKDRRELYPWQDEFLRLDTISHVITVHDRRAGDFTVILDGVSERRNWMFVYIPTSIYEDSSGLPPRVLGDGNGETERYRRGGQHRPDVRITGGSHCWRMYYGCNFCGAYSAQPRLREYRFSAPDGVYGRRVFYYVRAPAVKCPECDRITHTGSIMETSSRLGKSDTAIFCRRDRVHFVRTLTKDDTAWLTDPTSVVPFMGTVNSGLSIPADLAQLGVTNSTTHAPEHKSLRMLRAPGSLSVYHDIPSHWLSGTQFDWASALSPFTRPDPRAPSPSPSSVPQGAAQGQDGTTTDPGSPSSYWPPDPYVARPPSSASTRGLPPAPGDQLSQEEEAVDAGATGAPPPLPNGGVSPRSRPGSPSHPSPRRSLRLLDSRGKFFDEVRIRNLLNPFPRPPSNPPRPPAPRRPRWKRSRKRSSPPPKHPLPLP